MNYWVSKLIKIEWYSKRQQKVLLHTICLTVFSYSFFRWLTSSYWGTDGDCSPRSCRFETQVGHMLLSDNLTEKSSNCDSLYWSQSKKKWLIWTYMYLILTSQEWSLFTISYPCSLPYLLVSLWDLYMKSLYYKYCFIEKLTQCSLCKNS